MNETTENTKSTAQETAESATTAVKTFTQEEVNSIVSERLKREKDSLNKQFEQREREIEQRENKLDCRQYLTDNDYPLELVEIFNTDNSTDFISRVSAMVEKYPNFYKPQESTTAEDGQNGETIPNGFHKVNITGFHPYDSNPNATALKEATESGKIRRAFGID